MLQTILVPLDGSALAERALPYASGLARAASGRLILMRVTSSVGLTQQTPPQAAALAEIEALAASLRAAGVPAEAYVRHSYYQDEPHGDRETYEELVSRQICHVVRQRNVDLIAMSTHGRSGLGRWLYGSVADQVLRDAEVPVLLISPICERPWPAEPPVRILVPLDGSALAEEAIAVAVQLAEALRAELVLLRVVERYSPDFNDFNLHAERARAESYLQEVAAGLSVPARLLVLESAHELPATVIARSAREEGVHLVAMATHGRSGLARVLMGSVATTTLRQVDVPLLLVQPAAIRRARAEQAAGTAVPAGSGTEAEDENWRPALDPPTA